MADTRPTGDVITGPSLCAVWPEVSHRLTKLLTSRGAPADVVDDVVQEVAARVLAKGIVFADAMDLMRWAVPVALNLLVDNARAVQRVTPVSEDFDEPVADVADIVAHRDRLRRVLHALPQLSAADRAALASAEAPCGDRKEAVRLAVRRHRARRRLLALVDGVAAFAGLAGALLRRSGRTAATATVAIAVVPVAFLGGGSVDGAPPAAVAETRTDAERPELRPAAHRADVAAPPTLAAARTARRAPAARPVPKAPPAAPRNARRPVAVVGGGPTQVMVGERAARPNDALLCVWGPHVDACVGMPRHNGGRSGL